MTSAKPRIRFAGRLNWRQRLHVKLAGLFVTVFLALGAASYLANSILVEDQLLDEVDRYASSDTRRIVNALEALVSSTEQLATSLATVAGAQNFRDIAPGIRDLLQQSPVHEQLHSAGVWPEPGAAGRGRERASILWMRDAAGLLSTRPDYNNPDVIPYFREAWYTPAREAASGQCYWSPIRRELLDNALVITCSAPIRRLGKFLGVATVSLTRDGVRERFEGISDDGVGYALLADRENRLLGWTGNAAATLTDRDNPPRNLAELAKVMPEYNPLALSLHAAREEFLGQALESSVYDATTVTALQDGSREMPRADAESALAAIWNRLPGQGRVDPRAVARATSLDMDPVLGSSSKVFIRPVAGAHWQLIRTLPTDSGFTGASYFVNQSLAVTLSALAITLLLLFAGLRWMLLRPLRRMSDVVSEAEHPEEAIQFSLDESARNELGVVAHWYNERVRQLSEQMERASSTNSLLVMEVDERRKAQRSLEASRRGVDAALRMIEQAVIVTDARSRIQMFSAVAETLTGHSQSEALDRPLLEVFQAVLGADRMPVPDLAKVCLERGTRLDYSNGVFLPDADGGFNELSLSVAPINDENGRPGGALLVFRKRPAKVAKQADAESAPVKEVRRPQKVSGLPDTLAFEERIDSLIETARLTGENHALAYFDIDNVGGFNAAHGYRAGDELLNFLARQMRTAVGADAELFRLSADAFALLVVGGTAEAAEALADRVRKHVETTPFTWESSEFRTTVSAGICAFDGHVIDGGEVRFKAELACRRAKADERNCVRVFDAEIDEASAIRDDKIWVQRIKAGIEDNLFHLTTQWVAPSTQLAEEGEVYEVFLALEDEEGFWATPGEFLPVAERHHLTSDIDRWVLRATARALAKDKDAQKRIAFVSINLSGQSLVNPDLLQTVVDTLQKYPIPADMLCFEVQEQAVTEHPAEVAKFFDGMKAIGCRLAIDRFVGRNMSDLELMRTLPVNFVKLDAMGFRRIHKDELEKTVVESVLRVAHTLQKRVMIANLDEQELVDAWKKLGSDYVQGFVISKPTPMIFKPG